MPHLVNLECGRKVPSANLAVRLAVALGLDSPDELIPEHVREARS